MNLVIAGSSLVGRMLVSAFERSGQQVRSTARVPGGQALFCDLADPASVRRVLEIVKPSTIFQCAGGTSRQEAEEVHRLHVDGTQNVLEAVLSCAPESRVILFGSAAEYGPVPEAALPITEETPPQPVTSYGKSKLAQTRLAEKFARVQGLSLTVVRPFNILGPGLSPTYLASVLIERLRKAKEEGKTGPFPVYNGHFTRDWIDVLDVVDALMKIAAAPAKAGTCPIYNIASGQEHRVLDLAAVLCACAGPFEPIDAGPLPGHSDIPRSVGSPRKLGEAFGWSPKVGFQQSLQDMWRAT